MACFGNVSSGSVRFDLANAAATGDHQHLAARGKAHHVLVAGD